MSLGGLLSLGNILEKARSRPTTYHVAEGGLPNFNVKPPPSRATPTRDAAARVASVSSAPSAGSRVSRSPAGPPAGVEGSDARAVGGAQPEASTGAAPATPPALDSGRTRDRWRFWRGRRSGREARAELALAAVRVVRNDLYADDLELIPKPSPAARGITLGAEWRGRRAAGGGWRGWWAHWMRLLRWRRGEGG